MTGRRLWWWLSCHHDAFGPLSDAGTLGIRQGLSVGGAIRGLAIAQLRSSPRQCTILSGGAFGTLEIGRVRKSKQNATVPHFKTSDSALSRQGLEELAVNLCDLRATALYIQFTP